MTDKLANWQPRSPWILPNGCVTPEVSRWLETVITAALNAQASTGLSLQGQVNALQASEMTMQPFLGSPADFPDVLQPGAADAVMSDVTWQTNPSF